MTEQPQMAEIIACVLAGLGFYFTGMAGIRTNLGRVPGRRFREFIGRATKKPLMAAILGFLSGVVTQTSIGVSVILAGLISRGITTIPSALPMVAWANFGLVVLVYLIHLPLYIGAFYLVGISGLYLQFFREGRLRALFDSFFALGLLLIGIRLMKVYLTALAGTPDVSTFLSYAPASNLLALLFGTAVRTVIQSTAAIVVLGLILNSAGIFNNDQTLMVLFGTALGTGTAALFLTSHFQGVMRQITLFEAAINVAAGLTMVILFYVEFYFHIPLVQALANEMPSGTVPEGHLAALFLFQQSLSVIYTFATLRWMPAWLEWYSPTTKEQDLSRPRFISDEATQDFDTGLTLAERELAGLVQRLPGYLQTVRTEHAQTAAADPRTLHNASLAVMGELESFLSALSDRGGKRHALSVALLQTQRRLDLVAEVEDCVWQIVQMFRGQPPTGKLQSVARNVVEALDTLLLTGVDAVTSNTAEDIEMLGLITSSPGDVVDRLRRNYLREEHELEHDERILILSVLSQYERIVWSLQQLSRSLQAGLIPGQVAA